jgi:hypothetical protein
VAADVLPEALELPVLVEEPGRVEAAGRLERGLSCTQRIRQGCDALRRHPEVAVDRGSLDRNRFESALPAHAARRRRVEVPLEPAAIELALDLDVDGVVGEIRRRPGGDGRDPLRPQKADRELLVVARRPHRDRHRLPADANLERLLDGELVTLRPRVGKSEDVDSGCGVRREHCHVELA